MKNVICVHCKEVYKDRPKKCPECGGQTFEYTLAEVKKQNVGTITWYPIETIPFIPEKQGGIWLLCYYGPNTVADSNYYWKATNSFTNDKKPSHWAYINYPE